MNVKSNAKNWRKKKKHLQHLSIACSSHLELSAVVICIIPDSSWSGWEDLFSNKMTGFKSRLQQLRVCTHKHTHTKYVFIILYILYRFYYVIYILNFTYGYI